MTTQTVIVNSGPIESGIVAETALTQYWWRFLATTQSGQQLEVRGHQPSDQRARAAAVRTRERMIDGRPVDAAIRVLAHCEHCGATQAEVELLAAVAHTVDPFCCELAEDLSTFRLAGVA